MFTEYSEADRLSFLKAVANVVASDHEVTEDERANLNQLVLGLGLSPLDERVIGEVMGELTTPGDLTAIISSLEQSDLKNHLFRVLVEVASCDKVITDGERAKVQEAAKVFGLNVDAASELLDWTVASIEHEKKEEDILERLGAAV